MKKLIVLSLLLVTPLLTYAQKPDLIVTTSGDSIACKIERIDETQIYYEVKEHNMFTIRRNAIVNEDILFNTYERIFPVNDKFGIVGKVGIMIFDPFFFYTEVAGLYFGPRHFMETGIGYISDPTNDDGLNSVTIRIGYRFQSFKGLLLKASIIAAPSEDAYIPLLGLGFAF